MSFKLTTSYEQSSFPQVENSATQFLRLTRQYALFHLLFFCLFLIEVILVLLFFPILAKSFLLAALVALTLLTAFSYFVLRFYFHAKKPEQFIQIRDDFIRHCHSLYQEDSLTFKRHIFLQTFHQLIDRLEGQEYQYYRLPFTSTTFNPLLKKLSVWLHWEDIHLMKELLYNYCIRTQLEWIKKDPINMDIHAALAQSYQDFYKIYQNPVTNHQSIYSFILNRYLSPEMVQKFQRTAQCAIEELKVVLYEYPNDIRCLTQLAYIYHDLDLKEDKQRIYESLLQLTPQDKKIQYELGLLYFQLGLVTEGLKMFDQLKKVDPQKAESLIQEYDSFHIQNL